MPLTPTLRDHPPAYLSLVIGAVRPHVVVLSTDDQDSVAACGEFLQDRDGGTVLIVVDDARMLDVIRSENDRTVLGDLPPGMLAAMVRRAVES